MERSKTTLPKKGSKPKMHVAKTSIFIDRLEPLHPGATQKGSKSCVVLLVFFFALCKKVPKWYSRSHFRPVLLANFAFCKNLVVYRLKSTWGSVSSNGFACFFKTLVQLASVTEARRTLIDKKRCLVAPGFAYPQSDIERYRAVSSGIERYRPLEP